MRSPRLGDLVPPAIVGTLAFSLRAWNVLSIGRDFYANFLSDASTYRLWASGLASGASYGESAFPMGPLFPYFLALNLKLGLDFYSFLFVQAGMGACVSVCVYLIARRMFGRPQAILSGLLTAAFAPFIFYDSLLLSESLQIFLLSISLCILVSAEEGENPLLPRQLLLTFLAGSLIGLTALGRGTILVFPVLVAIFWLSKVRQGCKKVRRRRATRCLLLLAGVAIGVAPATIHNLVHGDRVLISSNMGINFFIGNHANASGTYEEPPGLDLSGDFTGRKIAESELGHTLKSSEVSSFWISKALEDIKGDFSSFWVRLATKIWLYLWYYDIPQAESIHIQRRFSPLFRFPLVGFGFILLFGLAAMLLLPRDGKSWLMILLFLSNIMGIVIFFVIGRFRLPGSLALLIMSGAGMVMVFENVANGRWKKLAVFCAVAVSVLAILYLPRPIDVKARLASAYDNVGIFYHYKGQPQVAMGWFRRALEACPLHAPSLNDIGAYFYSAGMSDSAGYYFRKSLQADSTQDKAWLNLGRLARNQGKLDSAYLFYQQAKKRAPFGLAADEAIRQLEAWRHYAESSHPDEAEESFEEMLARAEQLSAAGQYPMAERYYVRALTRKPNDIRALNNLGFAYQAQGKYQQAAEQFSRVLRLSPDNAVAYNNLASVVYRLGLVDSAKALWRQAITLDPNNPRFKSNLDYIQRQGR